MTSSRPPASLLLVPLIFAALACANASPPRSEISTAELALSQAETVNASQLAPLSMRVAREKLDEAKAIVAKGGSDEMRRAKRLAEDATLEAQFAEQTARAEAAKKALAEAQRAIDALRRGAGLDAN